MLLSLGSHAHRHRRLVMRKVLYGAGMVVAAAAVVTIVTRANARPTSNDEVRRAALDDPTIVAIFDAATTRPSCRSCADCQVRRSTARSSSTRKRITRR